MLRRFSLVTFGLRHVRYKSLMRGHTEAGVVQVPPDAVSCFFAEKVLTVEYFNVELRQMGS